MDLVTLAHKLDTGARANRHSSLSTLGLLQDLPCMPASAVRSLSLWHSWEDVCHAMDHNS